MRFMSLEQFIRQCKAIIDYVIGITEFPLQTQEYVYNMVSSINCVAQSNFIRRTNSSKSAPKFILHMMGYGILKIDS